MCAPETVNATPTRPPAGFAAAVLAGGRSSRMAADKAFIRWKGTRLIERQLATLRALAPVELLISGRSGVDYASPNVRVVLDAEPDQGPLGGIAAVLEATDAHHVVILAVDLPAMTPAFLHQLQVRCRRGVGAVVRTLDGWEPLAAVYPREILPLVQARLARRELALQSLIAEAVGAGLLAVIEAADTELGSFKNFNTPADLAT